MGVHMQAVPTFKNTLLTKKKKGQKSPENQEKIRTEFNLASKLLLNKVNKIQQILTTNPKPFFSNISLILPYPLKNFSKSFSRQS